MKPFLLFLAISFIYGGMLFGQKSNYELGSEYLKKKEYKKALNEFSKCNDSLKCLLWQSLTYMKLGKFESAKSGFHTIILNQEPNNFHLNLYFRLGICCYYLEQYDSSIFYQKKEIYSDKFDLTPDFHLATYFNLGKSFYKLEQYDSSVTYLEKCLKYDSTDLDCNYWLAKSYYLSGKQDESLFIIDYTLSKFPEDTDFLTLRGFLMFDAQNGKFDPQKDGSLFYYEKAMQLGWKPKGIERKMIRLLRKQRNLQE